MSYRTVSTEYCSEEESDSDDDICWKRRKSNVLSQSGGVPVKNRRRNHTWKNVAEEHKLDEALSGAGMYGRLDSTREVESYFIHEECDKNPVGAVVENPVKSASQSVRERLGPMSWDQSIPRSHIDVSFDTPSDVLAESLIKLLNEPNEDLIKRVVNVLGCQRALEIYYLTEDIERSGGLYCLDGSRRRSPGGVYLNIINHSYDITKEERRAIFFMDRKLKDKLKRMRRRRKRKRDEDGDTQVLPLIVDDESNSPFENFSPEPTDQHSLNVDKLTPTVDADEKLNEPQFDVGDNNNNNNNGNNCDDEDVKMESGEVTTSDDEL